MKILRLIVLIISLCVINSRSYCNTSYDNNSNIRLAHKELYALHMSSAETLLQDEAMKNPGNGYITYYRLYSEMIRLTIYNSPDEFRKSRQVLNKYIKMLKELPDNGPDYRLLLGEAYVFIGLINVRYDNKFAGLVDCLKGYNLLEDNARKYPQFEPDDKILGIIEIGVNFMPKMLRWGIKLFNIDHNAYEGLKKLSRFSEFSKGKPGYEEESLLFTMAAYRLMNREEEAINLINDNINDFKDYPVLSLMATTVCLQANNAETALVLLSNINPESLEIPFPMYYYMKGKAKLTRLDRDSDNTLMTFLKVSSGDDYIKSILYDLACFSYISGNTYDYMKYLEQVKVKGREYLSRDIEADFEAEKTELPNISLMCADLLVKGGYCDRAEEELLKVNNLGALNESGKVLYYYLRGECYRLKNLVGKAESEYLIAVNAGERSGDHIGQKALVNSGLMMERNNLPKEAEKYYKLSLQYKATNNPYSYFYKNSARAGLIRLSLSE